MVWWLRYRLGVGIWIELEALKTKLVRHRVQPGQVEHALAEAFRARDNNPYFDVDMDGLTTWVRARGRYVDDNNDDSNDDDWRDYGDDGPGPIPSARAMGPIPIGARKDDGGDSAGQKPEDLEDDGDDGDGGDGAGPKPEDGGDDGAWPKDAGGDSAGPKPEDLEDDGDDGDGGDGAGPKPKEAGGDGAGPKPEDLEEWLFAGPKPDEDGSSTEPGTLDPPCRVCGLEGCNNSCLPSAPSVPSDSLAAKAGPKPAGRYIRANFSACPKLQASPTTVFRPPPPPPPRSWISESDMKFGDMMAARLASQPPPPSHRPPSQPPPPFGAAATIASASHDLAFANFLAGQRDIENRFLIDAAVLRRSFELQRQRRPR